MQHLDKNKTSGKPAKKDSMGQPVDDMVSKVSRYTSVRSDY